LEREPFFHAQEEDAEGFQITRFLSLAPYGNLTKQKWIYAFSLDPKAAPPVAIPSGTTASPLTVKDRKRKALADQAQAFSRFPKDGGGRHRNKRARQPPPTPQECFFCLSNPNLATHLIASIGNSAYLTTAKGPLSTSSTFKTLGCPSHILIIPLEHSPTLSAITDATSRQETIAEMQRYRNALHGMLAARSKATDPPTESAEESESDALGAVTWEVSRAGGIHVHWQFLPIPTSLISRGLVEAAFKVEAENDTYPAFKTTSTLAKSNGLKSTGVDDDRGDYFRATIWSSDNEPETVLTLPLDQSFRFDLQFGRRVLAKLLGLERRMHWQDCAQSEEEETVDVEKFKEAFKERDFALEEE